MTRALLAVSSVLLLVLAVLCAVPRCSYAQSFMCMSDDDCELNGVCSAAMTCECDPGWKGDACSELDFLPASFNTGYNLTGSGTSSWGGKIIPDPSDPRLHHLFAAEFVHGCGLDYWSPMSRIIRAESRSGPAGPYKFAQEVVGTFAHNPTVVWSEADRLWLLYHIGCETTPPAGCASMQLACDGGNNENGESGVTVRSSPDLVTWTSHGQILSNNTNGTWDCDSTNPSPLPLHSPHHNTSAVLLVYRGCPWNCDGDELISLAAARSFTGPYHRLSTTPIFAEPNEDPFVWRDRHGHFHMLLHSLEPGGGFDGPRVGRHAYTRDLGSDWTWGNHTLAYNTTVEFDTGDIVVFFRRERPQLLLSDDGALTPLYLINGVQPKNGGGATYTLIQPLAPSRTYEQRMRFGAYASSE